MKQYLKWADREYPFTTRVLATLPAGVLFAGLIPLALLKLIPRLDALFPLPRLDFGPVNVIAGVFLGLTGLAYALWSIVVQFTQAGGTPIPPMPTHTLLVTAPFSHCRNPMAFGTILFYLGIAVLARSLSSLITVVILAALLILYIKRVEERELEARFGDAYLDYKSTTPFILPRIR